MYSISVFFNHGNIGTWHALHIWPFQDLLNFHLLRSTWYHLQKQKPACISFISYVFLQTMKFFLAPTLFHRGGVIDLAMWLTHWLKEKFAPGIMSFLWWYLKDDIYCSHWLKLSDYYWVTLELLYSCFIITLVLLCFGITVGLLWTYFCLFWDKLFESLSWLPSQLLSTSVLIL